MAGSSGGTGPNGQKKARIEIIPLIDVVFFLLATFVLFTISLNKSNGISVHLPSSTTAGARDPNNSVTITIMDDNTLAWDKDPISLEEFIGRLSNYHIQQGDEARILVNGDEGALFGSARYVLDEIRKSGIKKVLIECKVAPQQH